MSDRIKWIHAVKLLFDEPTKLQKGQVGWV